MELYNSYLNRFILGKKLDTFHEVLLLLILCVAFV